MVKKLTKKSCIAISLITIIIFNICLVGRAKILASETVVSKVYSDDILDTGKSILYYVLYTKNIDTKTQLNDLGISEDKVQEIQELALEQMKFVNETKYF